MQGPDTGSIDPNHGNSAIAGVTPEGDPLQGLHSPLSVPPYFTPVPAHGLWASTPYDSELVRLGADIETQRWTALGSFSSQLQSEKSIYIVTSSSASLNQLETALQSRGATTIQLKAEESLSDLVDRLKAIAPPGGFDAIHLLGHGAPGQFTIGRQTLTSRNVWRHKDELTQLGQLLNESGDLLLYGCETGKGTAGQRLIDSVAKYTGADVAASDDITYSNLLTKTSDWDLEEHIGSIEANQDLLTGLNWQGELGGTASIVGTELKVTGASGSIGIAVNALTKKIDITGTSSPQSLTASPIKLVTITGDSFNVSGINLDDNTADKIYPDSYDVKLTAKGSNGTFSLANSGDLSILGPIKTFGGNLSIASPGKISIFSGNANEIATLVDTRKWYDGTPKIDAGKTIAGDFDISCEPTVQDLPFNLWFPQVNINVEIGNGAGSGKTKIFANDISIVGAATIAATSLSKYQDLITNSYIGDLIDISSIATSLQGSILPFSVKTGSAKATATFTNTEMQAEGGISLEWGTELTLGATIGKDSSHKGGSSRSKTTTTGKVSSLVKLSIGSVSAAATIGSVTTELGFKNSIIAAKDGDIELTNTAANELETEDTLALSPNKKDDGSTTNKIALSAGISVANTKSSIVVDSTSQIKASGSVSISNEATTSTKSKSSTAIFEGGRGVGAVSVETDKGEAIVQIDGLIQAEGKVYEDPKTTTDYVKPWQLVQTLLSNGTYAVKDKDGKNIDSASSIANGTVIADNFGTLYTFTAAPSAVDLHTVTLADDPRFSLGVSTSFKFTEKLATGDDVTVENINTGYTYKLITKADNSLEVKDKNDKIVGTSGSKSPITLQPNDRVLWTGDNSEYMYIGKSPLPTSLRQIRYLNCRLGHCTSNRK
jgi:hypothetical protein